MKASRSEVKELLTKLGPNFDTDTRHATHHRGSALMLDELTRLQVENARYRREQRAFQDFMKQQKRDLQREKAEMRQLTAQGKAEKEEAMKLLRQIKMRRRQGQGQQGEVANPASSLPGVRAWRLSPPRRVASARPGSPWSAAGTIGRCQVEDDALVVENEESAYNLRSVIAPSSTLPSGNTPWSTPPVPLPAENGLAADLRQEEEALQLADEELDHATGVRFATDAGDDKGYASAEDRSTRQHSSLEVPSMTTPGSLPPVELVTPSRAAHAPPQNMTVFHEIESPQLPRTSSSATGARAALAEALAYGKQRGKSARSQSRAAQQQQARVTSGRPATSLGGPQPAIRIGSGPLGRRAQTPEPTVALTLPAFGGAHRRAPVTGFAAERAGLLIG